MAIPSRILASGNSPLATISIAGDGATALTAAGTNQATALQLSAVANAIGTTASSTGVKLPRAKLALWCSSIMAARRPCRFTPTKRLA